MDTDMSKVYVLPDADGRITRIDGGITVSNILDFTGWVLIDEGTGDRYNLCQGNYLPGPLTDERGVYRYKLVDGKPVERTQEEMDADYVEPELTPSTDERVAQLEAQNETLLECLLEMSEIVYA